MADKLIIGSFKFNSRLLVGTGKYKDIIETEQAVLASGAEVVTVAVRMADIHQSHNKKNLLEVITPEKYTILPNTAGCYDVDSAYKTCQLARELLDGHNLVKLEVIGDEKLLYPNVRKTIDCAIKLVADGFQVMCYASDDPLIASELESIGCVAVMPLASPIGSGLGICNPYNLEIIINNAKVPIIVDAGIGSPKDAVFAMELGADAVLLNTAIASAKQPILMAESFKLAVQAGRKAFLAGRMEKKRYASASSPTFGYSF